MILIYISLILILFVVIYNTVTRKWLSPYKISVYMGLPGSGKTTSISDDTYKWLKKGYKSHSKKIDSLLKGYFKFSGRRIEKGGGINSESFSFPDYPEVPAQSLQDLCGNLPDLKWYIEKNYSEEIFDLFDGYRVYTNVVNIPGTYFIDHSFLDIKNERFICNGKELVLIDEAGISFNNRKYKDMPQSQIEFLKLFRHYKLRINFYSQADDIDITILRLCDTLYVVEKFLRVFVKIRKVDRTLGPSSAYKSDSSDSSKSGPSGIVSDYNYSPIIFPGAIAFKYIPKVVKRGLFDSYDLASERYLDLINNPEKYALSYNPLNEVQLDKYQSYKLSEKVLRIIDKVKINFKAIFSRFKRD